MFKVLFFVLVFSSCSKLSYLTHQGIGQFKLEWNSKENQTLLADPSVTEETKNKIRKIETYKKFFFDYFERKQTGIYTDTTILKQPAVSYLVIASSFDKLEALEHSFPIVGTFPYLGFFDKKKATEFASSLENDSYVTWVRPVYAYSTLGWFEDNILSSFFFFNDYDLAELIFHELFHTLFFINSDVTTNENLADFFAKEMTQIYFENDTDFQRFNEKRKHMKSIRISLVEKIKEFKNLLKQTPPKDRKTSDDFFQNFYHSNFQPFFTKKCDKLKLDKNCYPLKGDWNMARFVAYMTYTEKQDRVNELFTKSKLTLKDFFKMIENHYKNYKRTSNKKGFINWMEKQL